MKPILPALAAAALMMAAASPAPAQTAPATATGPALNETLGFIADRMTQQGQINYAASMSDSADGQTWVNQFTVLASDITADVDACRVNFHWRTTVDGKEAQNFDTGLPFGRIDHLDVTDMAADLAKTAAQDGHPTWTGQVNPTVWVITAYRTDGTANAVDFTDHDIAERVARAMRHAIDLCGGAAGQPF